MQLRFLSGFLFLLLSVSLSYGQTITIADSALRSVIRDLLEKPSGAITQADMESIIFLDASGRGVENLSGLQFATNLVDLRLQNNFISDLQPIENLSGLLRLRVQNNDLDISTGSPDRLIIDSFISDGVEVIFQPQGMLAPVISEQPQSQTVEVGDSVTLSVTVAGSGPFSFQWEKDGTELPGQTSSSFTLSNLRISDSGDYAVRVSLTAQPGLETLSEVAGLEVLPPDTPVDFPDTALRNAVRSALGLTGSQEITWRNLFNLSTLNATNANISRLQGLEQAVNLESINLSNNSITSLGALAPLANLESLNVSNNFLDLGPTSPDGILIEDLRARGATVITGTQGQRLQIVAQPVDQTTVAGGQVSFAVRATSAQLISYQWIRNGTDIPGANSATLRLNDVDSSDVGSYRVRVSSAGQQVLSNEVRLTLTSTSGSPEFDDRNLERAIRRQLGIRRGDEITAEAMRDLVMLDLSNRNIEKLDGLEFAINLMDLRLVNNKISDLTPLRGLNNLIWLDLTRNRITDISPLSGLQSLAWLYLDRNFIRDASPLAGLINLVEVRIRQNFLDARDGSQALALANSLEDRGTIARFLPQGTPPKTDFDGDGLADLIFFNEQKQKARTWILNGDGGVLEDVDLGRASPGWEVALTSDLTGNAITDILWFNNETRQVGAFLSDGAEIGIAWQFFGLGPQGYIPRFSADLLNNGFPDLIWYQPTTGQVGVWFQYASGYDTQLFQLGRAETFWAPVAVDIFDDSGIPGILWHNANEGQVSVWFLRSNATIRSWDIIGITSPDWVPFGVGDLDSDGRNDIAFFNPRTGEVAAMLLGPTGTASFFLGIGQADEGWEPVTLLDAFADGNLDIIFSRFEEPTPQSRFKLRRPPSDRVGILRLDGQGNPIDWKAIRIIDANWELIKP